MIQRIHLSIADEVIAFLQSGHILFAGTIAAHGNPLEITVTGNCKHYLLTVDHCYLIDNNFFDFMLNACQARCLKGLLHLVQLANHHLFQHPWIFQNIVQLLNFIQQHGILLTQLCDIRRGQTIQTHGDNSLCLRIAESKGLHDAALGIRLVLAGTNQCNDFIQNGYCLDQPLQYMTAVFLLFQIKTASALNHLTAMLDKGIQHRCQTHLNRTLVNDRHNIIIIGNLQIGIFIQIIQNYLSIGILFHIHNDTQTVTVTFIPDIENTLDFFVQTDIIDLFDHIALDDFIWNFRDDNLLDGLLLLDFRLAADDDAALSGFKGFPDSFDSLNDSSGWKIRTLYVFHQLIQRAVRMLDTIHSCIDRLAQIVRRDVGRIPGSDPRNTIDEQIWIPGRKHRRLHCGIIEVRCPQHSFLFDIL